MKSYHGAESSARKTKSRSCAGRVKALVNDAAHGLDDGAALRATAERDRVRKPKSLREGRRCCPGMSDMEREFRRAEWQRQEHPVKPGRIDLPQ